MKILLTILLTFPIFASLNAQKVTNYNTNIDTATRVEIENGVINIKKADTVIIKVIIAQNNSQLFVDSFSQVRDTSGLYQTTIKLVSNKIFTTDYELVFLFDSPIERMSLSFLSQSVTQGMDRRSKDKKLFAYSGKTTAKRLVATIWSKSKPKIEIKGVEGVIKR